jgi:hypothetical protein
MAIVAAEMPEELVETIALTIAETPNEGVMFRHDGTPAQVRDCSGLRLVQAVTGAGTPSRAGLRALCAGYNVDFGFTSPLLTIIC